MDRKPQVSIIEDDSSSASQNKKQEESTSSSKTEESSTKKVVGEEEKEIPQSIHLGVVDQMLSELNELSSEISRTGMYDVRQRTISSWHGTLTRSLNILNQALYASFGDYKNLLKWKKEYDEAEEEEKKKKEQSAVKQKGQKEQNDSNKNSPERDDDDNEVDRKKKSKLTLSPGIKPLERNESGNTSNTGSFFQLQHSSTTPIDEITTTTTSTTTTKSTTTATKSKTNLDAIVSPQQQHGRRSQQRNNTNISSAMGGSFSNENNNTNPQLIVGTNNNNINTNSNQQQQQQPPALLTNYVSGSVYLILDSLLATLNCSWCSCFVHSAKSNDLVLVASVGTRRDQRPGTLRLSATSGIESLVLTSGVAMNITHAHAESEFNKHQDELSSSAAFAKNDTAGGLSSVLTKESGSPTTSGERSGSKSSSSKGGAARMTAASFSHERTRSQLLFPLIRPAVDGTGYGSHTFGIIMACNKHQVGAVDLASFLQDPSEKQKSFTRVGNFTIEDEHRVAEAAHILTLILSRHPCDIATPLAFDPVSLLSKSSSMTSSDSGVIGGKAVLIPNPLITQQKGGDSAQKDAAQNQQQTKKPHYRNSPTSSSTAKIHHQTSSSSNKKEVTSGRRAMATNLSPRNNIRRSPTSTSTPTTSSKLDNATQEMMKLLQNETNMFSNSASSPQNSQSKINNNVNNLASPNANANVNNLSNMSSVHSVAATNDNVLSALTIQPPSRHSQLVYRTSKAGHVKRNDMFDKAATIPHVNTITDAMDQVTKVNAGWRNAVLLNVELEEEVKRFKMQIQSLQRENARLQSIVLVNTANSAGNKRGGGSSQIHSMNATMTNTMGLSISVPS